VGVGTNRQGIRLPLGEPQADASPFFRPGALEAQTELNTLGVRGSNPGLATRGQKPMTVRTVAAESCLMAPRTELIGATAFKSDASLVRRRENEYVLRMTLLSLRTVTGSARFVVAKNEDLKPLLIHPIIPSATKPVAGYGRADNRALWT
jgi:hypothetical protein